MDRFEIEVSKHGMILYTAVPAEQNETEARSLYEFIVESHEGSLTPFVVTLRKTWQVNQVLATTET